MKSIAQLIVKIFILVLIFQGVKEVAFNKTRDKTANTTAVSRTATRSTTSTKASTQQSKSYTTTSSEIKTTSSYSTSSSDDSLEAYTYSLNDVDHLNGLFQLKTSDNKLIQMYDKLRGKNITWYQGLSKKQAKKYLGHMGFTMDDARVIDRANGEKLVLIGYEWSNLSKSEQDSMMILRCKFPGYGNYSMLNEVDMDNTKDIRGNKVFSFRYNVMNNIAEKTTILSTMKNDVCTYSSYEGTKSTQTKIAMINPCYIALRDNAISVPIKKTQKGYFIVDVSSLASGYYVVSSYSGLYPVYIK